MANNQMLFANNANSFLSGAITNTSTSLQVQAGGGAQFPNPGANQYFVFTLVDAATGLLREICWCTARTGDTFTNIVRGQEGTEALNWNPNDLVNMLLTAGEMGQFVQQGQVPASQIYYGADTGSVNALVVNPTAPYISSLTTGSIFEVTPRYANTSATVNMNINGIGNYPVRRADGSALAIGDIQPSPAKALFGWDSSVNEFLMINPSVWTEFWSVVGTSPTNTTVTVYNAFVEMGPNTGGSSYVATLPSPVGRPATQFIVLNDTSFEQTLATAAGGFVGAPQWIPAGATSIVLNRSQIVSLFSDGNNWVVTTNNEANSVIGVVGSTNPTINSFNNFVEIGPATGATPGTTTIPSPVLAGGFSFTIFNASNCNQNIESGAGLFVGQPDWVSGANPITLTESQLITVVSDGSNWIVTANNMANRLVAATAPVCYVTGYDSFVEISGSSAVAVYIPTPVGLTNVTFTIYNASTLTQAITSAAGGFIGRPQWTTPTNPIVLTAGQIINVRGDGTNWVVTSNNGA